MRVTMIVLIACCATACATARGPKITLVETDPPGAFVQVEGFGSCETPCRIELDAPRNLTIAKAGYDARRLVLQPGTKTVSVKLTLSAPTTGVEAQPLPEL